MARESDLWRWIKFHQPDAGSVHLERVENLLKKAMPDIEGCVCGASFWLETKVLHKMTVARTAGSLKWEDGQREWGQRRWNAGGAAYALIGVPMNGQKDRVGQVFLVPGLFLPSFQQSGVVEIESLTERCLLARILPTVPYKDGETLDALFGLLRSPVTARRLTAEMEAERPEFAYIARSPTDSLIDELISPSII